MPGAKMFAFFALVFVIGTILGGVTEGTSGISVSSLSSNIDDEVNIIPVSSTEGFPSASHPTSQRHIIIESEVIQYTAITEDPDTFTGCTRGDAHPRTLAPSDAVAHSEGDRVMNPSTSAMNNLIGGIMYATSSASFGDFVALIAPWGPFWPALWQMLTWDYAFFHGQLGIIRILFVVVFSGGFLFGLTLMFITLAQGLFRR